MDIDYSNIRPEDFRTPDYDSLIKFRIRRILMICSNYDAFIMEEDGQIESKVYKEYVGLNMSDPPQYSMSFIVAISSSEITKSNTSVFSIILDGVTDFGRGIVPFCRHQRMQS